MKKNRLSAASFASALLLLFFVPQAGGQVPSFSGSTVTGFVFDSQRRPVGQIPVELIDDVNGVVQRIRTDGSGRFIFRGVSQGRFQVRVLPLGTNYEEQTQEVELFGLGASGRKTLTVTKTAIYLRPSFASAK
jgi:hypothetical protein